MEQSYKNKLVSIIIPNLNGKHLFKTCLTSLRKQTFKNFEVIVVDNGSDDGSADYIRRFFSEIKVIQLDKNYGFAKAVNEGIKKSKGKYLMLLNNDTEVDKRCIEYLVKSANEHREVGFISAKILNFYRRNIIDNAGDYLDSVGHLYSRGFGRRDGLLFDKDGYIFLGTGSGTLFKRQVFDKVGLFDEDYFFYMEDADLCLRAQLSGFKGWFEPRARIYHIRMATSSKSLKNYECLVFQNMTVTVIKNFPRTVLLNNFNWLKIILTHLNTLRYLIFRSYRLDVIRIEWYLLTNLKSILEKRRKVQALKKVSDAYILANIKPKRLKVGKLLAL